jgi:hypothetical protein
MSTTTTDVTAEPEIFVCSLCLKELPAVEFHLRAAGGTVRDTRCKTCYAAWRRRRRGEKREAGIRAFARDVASGEVSDRQLIKLSQVAIRRFGGPAKLGAALAEQAKLAIASGNQSRGARLLLAILRISKVAEDRRREIGASRRPKRDPSAMETDELKGELLAVIGEALGVEV